MHVDIGDRVRKGQLLAVLDKEPYRLDVDAAQAELVTAEAKVVNTKEEYDRQERVYSQGAGAKSKLEQAKYNLDAARSQVNYQIAKLNIAKRNLGKTMLTSPYDGYIAWRSVDPHEEVKVGQKVFAIDAKGALEVGLAVPETTINQITYRHSDNCQVSHSARSLCTRAYLLYRFCRCKIQCFPGQG